MIRSAVVAAVFVSLGCLHAGCGGSRRPPSLAAAIPSAGDAEAGAPEIDAGSGAAAEGRGTGFMSLAELMDAEVLIEDLTPGLVFDDERHDPRAPTTRVLLFEARRGAPPRLDGVVEREESWAPPLDVVARPDARWRLLGASDDRVLAEGALALPALCPCGEAGSHIVGDVRYPHESWFRLDLPRHEGQERLELLDAAGDVLGAWILSTPG